ncbi:uncharacterized protein LOC117175822 [Belonocnema kinseyi]|uniref:uncharacterized protein LOC117175822 n=1 Tax=Belonocnema kinseyi TaxID=2817044 RepID=UPI00143CCCD9|nr:uncharacterized protein LOC117175822 [Belonocnema kinseyi]
MGNISVCSWSRTSRQASRHERSYIYFGRVTWLTSLKLLTFTTHYTERAKDKTGIKINAKDSEADAHLLDSKDDTIDRSNGLDMPWPTGFPGPNGPWPGDPDYALKIQEQS